MEQFDTKPSERELEVLGAVIEYGTLQGAADALGIARETVDKHIDHLREKSGLRRIVQIAVWAIQSGWLGPVALKGDEPDEDACSYDG